MYVMTSNGVVFYFLIFFSFLLRVCHAQIGHSTDRGYSWTCEVHAATAVIVTLLYLRIVIGRLCPQKSLFPFPTNFVY